MGENTAERIGIGFYYIVIHSGANSMLQVCIWFFMGERRKGFQL